MKPSIIIPTYKEAPTISNICKKVRQVSLIGGIEKGRTYQEGKKINWNDVLHAIYCILWCHVSTDKALRMNWRMLADRGMVEAQGREGTGQELWAS